MTFRSIICFLTPVFNLFQGVWETSDSNFGWLNWQVNFPDVAMVNRVAIQGACHHSNPVRCCGAERWAFLSMCKPEPLIYPIDISRGIATMGMGMQQPPKVPNNDQDRANILNYLL